MYSCGKPGPLCKDIGAGRIQEPPPYSAKCNVYAFQRQVRAIVRAYGVTDNLPTYPLENTITRLVLRIITTFYACLRLLGILLCLKRLVASTAIVFLRLSGCCLGLNLTSARALAPQ